MQKEANIHPDLFQPDFTFDSTGETVQRMVETADAFLKYLEPGQRQKAVFSVDDKERLNWDYRPKFRAGLPLKAMDSSQRHRALALLASGLSTRANITALNIMSLERILGMLEGAGANHQRDPELYFVSFFGEPHRSFRWGWRFEGHHLSLSCLIDGNDRIAVTPNFFGANPARILAGSLQGFRTLRLEEESGRRLINSLAENQKKQAVFTLEAPPDIVTSWSARIRLDEPVGIALSDLQPKQQHLLMELVRVYVGRIPPKLAERYMAEIEKEGPGYIHFAWAGSNAPGEPHYYRLQGPSFLVEYDNTQNNANHIHSVWRDVKRDWGDDLLKNHYKQSHPVPNL